ncbi:MAG: ECF transporter S component, partial [Chloroflexota bacterium]|nr:ECF transporter S component [Chloroflexota bacterium]
MNRAQSWRTVDILVAAAIGVAFGVVFWAWNLVWAAATPVFLAFPPSQYLLYGIWLLPGVLGGLVVRKPGAALFTELVAASASALIGSQWGLDTVVSGALQGGAAELVFAVGRYRSWGPVTAVLAGAAAGVAAWLHDMPLYYPELPIADQLLFLPFMVASAAAVAGAGAW